MNEREKEEQAIHLTFRRGEVEQLCRALIWLQYKHEDTGEPVPFSWRTVNDLLEWLKMAL